MIGEALIPFGNNAYLSYCYPFVFRKKQFAWSKFPDEWEFLIIKFYTSPRSFKST